MNSNLNFVLVGIGHFFVFGFWGAEVEEAGVEFLLWFGILDEEQRLGVLQDAIRYWGHGQ